MAKAADRLMLRIADQAIVATPPAALQTVGALIRQRIPEGESLLVGRPDHHAAAGNTGG